MEIKDERKDERSTFKDLFPGDVFEFDDKTFMKIERIEFGSNENESYNAVRLNDGEVITFYPNEVVTPLVVQLHIVHNG